MAALTLDEIMSVDTIEGLKAVYQSKGLEFASEKEFLKSLKGDMKDEKERYLAMGLTVDRLPSLTATIDGVEYTMLGIIHNRVAKDEIRKLILSSLDAAKGFLIEQGLDFYNLKNAVDVKDQVSVPWGMNFIFGLKFGIRLPLFYGRLIKDYLTKEEVRRSDLASLAIPIELHRELPSYVDIELAERKGRYDYNLARSAAMAETMKAWHGDQRKIVTGIYHTPEILHFLKHGVKDQRIVQNAQIALDGSMARYMTRYLLPAFGGGTLSFSTVYGALSLLLSA